MKEKVTNSVKVYKKLRKHLNIYSYFLLNNNKINQYIYSLMVFIDFLVILIIPLETFLYFDDTRTDTQTYLNYNFYQISQKHGFSLYITDVINGYLLLFMLLLIMNFFRFDFRISNLKSVNDNQMIILSFLFLLTSRFIVYEFMVYQILAIKCYNNSSSCHTQTDIVRLCTNIVGLLICVSFMYLEYFQFYLIFPQPNVQWAQPPNKYRLIKRLMLVLAVLELVFMNDLISIVAFWIILLPLFCLQSIQIWVGLTNRTSFLLIPDIAIITRDVIAMLFIIYAIVIELCKDSSDLLFCILIIIMSVTLVILILVLKEQIQSKKIRMMKTLQKNEANQINLINTIYLYSQSKYGSVKHLELKTLYFQHICSCKDMKCPCQTQEHLGAKYQVNEHLIQRMDDGESHDMVELNNIMQQFDLNLYDESSGDQNPNQQLIDQSNGFVEVLLKVIFYQFKLNNWNLNSVFTEIFIRTDRFLKVYSSLYDLLQLKNKCNTHHYKYCYDYLTVLIFQKTKMIEKERKLEIFDSEQNIVVDTHFQDYKRWVVETTNLVERFWVNLEKQDFQVKEILQLSRHIVDQYLKVKSIYDKVIEKNPEFKEIINLNMQFNQNVLNFEVEAMQAANYLKNVEQKVKISQMNQYGRNRKEMGTIIVSQSPMFKNKIIYSNKILNNLLGYTSQQLINQDLNFLIPQLLQVVHTKMIEQYLMVENERYFNQKSKRIWIKKADGNFEVATLYLQLCLSEKYGILIVAFIEPCEQLITPRFSLKFKNSYVLIANDTGYIYNVSTNFYDRYLKKKTIILEDVKINIEDIFLNFHEFNQKELSEGVHIKMVKNFLNNSTQIQKLIDVILVIQYHSLNGLKFLEAIFFDDNHLSNTTNQDLATFNAIHDNSSSPNALLNQEELDDQLNQYARESMTESSASGSSTSSTTNNLLEVKKFIDFQSMPPSLQTLKKSLVIFFLILIGSSISVLAVTIISHKKFEIDLVSVQQSINLVGQLANLRLSFRLMILRAQKENNGFSYSQEEIQNYMELYYDGLRSYQDSLSDDVYDSSSSELYRAMKDPILQIQELKEDGKITVSNTTFNLGMYQFLTKVQQFFTKSESQLIKEFQTFSLRYDMKNASQVQRDAWFIIKNGNSNLRAITLDIADLYIEDGQAKEKSYSLTVLIIILSCIGITLISSFVLIPVTFYLDNEEISVAKKWFMIQQSTKQQVIFNISTFQQEMQNEKHQKKFKQINPLRNEASSGGQNGIFYEELSNSTIKPFNNNSLISKSQMQDYSDMPSMHISAVHESNQLFKAEKDSEHLSNNLSFEKQKLSRPIGFADGFKKLKGNLQNENSVQHDYVQGSEHDANLNLQSHNFTTTQHNSSVINQTQDDLFVQNRERLDQLDQLRKIYYYSKVKKGTAIMFFSLIIIGFYIISYVMTSNEFIAAQESFNYSKVVSRRGPCLTSAFSFLIETFGQNVSQKIYPNDQSLIDYVSLTCFGLEKTFTQYLKETPPELLEIKQELEDVNSNKACHIQFYPNKQAIQECESISNGIMKKGLESATSQIFYYVIHQMVDFNGRIQSNRTDSYLRQELYKEQGLQYIRLILNYMLPMNDNLLTETNRSILDYLTSKLNEYIIVFSIFTTFMVVSLILALKVVVEILKKIVFRSRILIKMIPTEELKVLQAKLKDNEKTFRI